LHTVVFTRAQRAGPWLVSGYSGLVVLLGTAAVAWADRGVPRQVSNIFDPVSVSGQRIVEISWFVIGVCAIIFLITQGILLWCIIKFRATAEDDKREPPQIYGSTPVEVAWTIVPMIIVTVLFLATARTIAEVQIEKPPEEALVVEVIGHRWWWEFKYPEYGFTTANELHIPTSTPEEKRPTFLRLLSQDVVHSFWVPRLGGKTDVVPNKENWLWFETSETGLYLGQCAEYCGTQHAHMLLRVYVETPEEFAAWVASQQAPAVVDVRVAKGRDAFQRTACVNCHTLDGTVANGTYGPDLSHFMSRETLGAGVALNTAANLRAWIRDPQELKPGCRMPDMKLTEPEVDNIVDYLLTLQ
jgi:cytochrome c oxidase subunit 2